MILSSFAKNVVQLPDSFWESIAEDYRREEYLVCMSVVGDEKPIKGTAALAAPINQMAAASEHAGNFYRYSKWAL